MGTIKVIYSCKKTNIYHCNNMIPPLIIRLSKVSKREIALKHAGTGYFAQGQIIGQLKNSKSSIICKLSNYTDGRRSFQY